MKLPSLGARIAILSWVFLPLAFSMIFVAHYLTARTSVEDWAGYAGKLQAGDWFQENHYRLLEISPGRNFEFTGRKEGQFEIWTWNYNTNSSWLWVDHGMLSSSRLATKG